jgi:hypothetical protein
VVFEKKKKLTLLSSMHATVMVMHYGKKKNWEKAGSVPALYSKYNILEQIYIFFILGFFKKYFLFENSSK